MRLHCKCSIVCLSRMGEWALHAFAQMGANGVCMNNCPLLQMHLHVCCKYHLHHLREWGGAPIRPFWIDIHLLVCSKYHLHHLLRMHGEPIRPFAGSSVHLLICSKCRLHYLCKCTRETHLLILDRQTFACLQQTPFAHSRSKYICLFVACCNHN